MPPSSSASLLRHPVFPSFWCARIASSFGYQMLSVAVGWQVYELTGRAFDLGLIGLVQFIPSVVLALPAGHFADQFERRRIVLFGQIVEWFAIVALTLLTFTGKAHEAGILALVFVVSVAKAFEFPALQSMLPSLVPAEILPRAMAASASAFQTAMIVGPALGGLLYALGPGVVYAAAAMTSVGFCLRMFRAMLMASVFMSMCEQSSAYGMRMFTFSGSACKTQQ